MLKRSYHREKTFDILGQARFSASWFPSELFGIDEWSSDQGGWEFRAGVVWVRPYFLEVFVYDLKNPCEGLSSHGREAGEGNETGDYSSLNLEKQN